MAGLKIAIAGGGIGGMAAAIALRNAGHDVEVFEQAADYKRVGADVNLTPNAVHALDSLGVVPEGKETARLEMADEAERKYGAPQLTIHRADLLDALRRQLPETVVKLNRRIAAIDRGGANPKIRFASGGEH